MPLDDDDDDENRAPSAVNPTLHKFTSVLPAVANTPIFSLIVSSEHDRIGPLAP